MLGVIGDLCRSMIIPAPGHRFIVGDFSAIEARVLAFLAGDADKLEAFRQFDLGLGRDIYCVTAEQVLGLSGVHGQVAGAAAREGLRARARVSMGADRLLATIRKANIPDTAGITITKTRRDGCKNGAPRTPRSSPTGRSSMPRRWRRCAIPECRSLPQPQLSDARWRLSLRLPSGRELSYPAPVIEPGRFGNKQIMFTTWKRGADAGRQCTAALGRERHAGGGAGPAGRRHEAATGGRLQAGDAHPRRDRRGDADRRGQRGGFKRLLVEVPAWAQGLPVAAKVFECDRFKKD